MKAAFSIMPVLLLFVGCAPIRPGYDLARTPSSEELRARELNDEIVKKLSSVRTLRVTYKEYEIFPEGDLPITTLTYQLPFQVKTGNNKALPSHKDGASKDFILDCRDIEKHQIQDWVNLASFYHGLEPALQGNSPQLAKHPVFKVIDGQEMLVVTYRSPGGDCLVYFSPQTKLPTQWETKYDSIYVNGINRMVYLKIELNPRLSSSEFKISNDR